MSYQPKVYREQGGDALIVAHGGKVTTESGSTVNLAGTTQIGGVTLTVNAGELNKLAGAGANVTAANLDTLTGGGNVAKAAGGHGHALAAGASDVTASAAELDKLKGAGANVTAANLDALTGGGNVAKAAGGHGHTLAAGASDVTASAAELDKLKGAGANVTAANLDALTGGGDIAKAAGGHGHTLAAGASDLTGTAANHNALTGGGDIAKAAGGHGHTLAAGGSDVTATAAEVNKLDGAALGTPGFVIGAEAGQVINVGIQLKDGNAVDLAVRNMVRAYLSDDANGDSLVATGPSGGCAIGTDGVLIPVTPALQNALLVDGNLVIDATPEKFKTTQTACYTVNGISRTKAATIELVFSAAHAIAISKFGVILIQIDAAGTISTKVPGSPQAYDTAADALAALPSPNAGNVALGYIAIENDAVLWTANTNSLTNGVDVVTATFNDAAETSIGPPKAFDLVSEADGDIDINITEVGVKTLYLVLVLPNGALAPSGAITFA